MFIISYLFHTYFKMDNLPLLPSETTLKVEGKIAHLFYDGNTGQSRDLIECFRSYLGEKFFILAQMGCLAESTITSLEEAMEYHALGEELDRVKRQESKDEKIIRAILLRMGHWVCSMYRFDEDTEEYPTLSEDVEMAKRNTPIHEMILDACDGLNLEKINVYE